MGPADLENTDVGGNKVKIRRTNHKDQNSGGQPAKWLILYHEK
jgi:hypothetical protein